MLKIVVWVHKHKHIWVYLHTSKPLTDNHLTGSNPSRMAIFSGTVVFSLFNCEPWWAATPPTWSEASDFGSSHPRYAATEQQPELCGQLWFNCWLSFGLISSWQSCQSHLIKSPTARGGSCSDISTELHPTILTMNKSVSIDRFLWQI